MILKKICLILILYFLSNAVLAMGLGYAKVDSYINQPLNATIELKHLGQIAPEDIKVYLATALDFQRFGIDKTLFLRKLIFKVVYINGQNAEITVTTKKPIKEPLVDFVITIQWPEGNITRDYSLFLNPNPAVARVDKTLNKTRNKRKSYKKSNASVRVRNQSNRVGSNNYTAASDYQASNDYANNDYSGENLGSFGPIGNGDSISMIAKKIRPDDSYSVQRIMRAIHRMNPDSFIDGDIDRLKVGAMLNIPPLERAEFKKSGYSYSPSEGDSSTLSAPQTQVETITTPKFSNAARPKPTQEGSELKLLAGGAEQELTMLDIENPTQEDIDSVSNKLIKLTLARVKRLKEENKALRERFDMLVGRMEEAVEKNARLDEQLAALQQSNQSLADGDLALADDSSLPSDNSSPRDSIIPSDSITKKENILEEVDADIEDSFSASIKDELKNGSANEDLLNKDAKNSLAQEKPVAKAVSQVSQTAAEIQEPLPKVVVKANAPIPAKSDEGLLDSILNWLSEYLSIWYGIIVVIIALIVYGYKTIWPKYRGKVGIMDKFSVYKKYSGTKVAPDDDIDDIDLDLFEAKPEESKDSLAKEPSIGSADDLGSSDLESSDLGNDDEIEEFTATNANSGLLSAQEESAAEELDDIFGDTSEEFNSDSVSGSSVQSSVLPASDGQIDFNDILGSGSSSESKSSSSVDIISQCSVYFAYGKFDLAEQLILDGLETEPDNKGYKLKLMECYAKMDSEENFLSYLSKCSDLYSGDEEFREKIQKMYQDRWKKELY